MLRVLFNLFLLLTAAGLSAQELSIVDTPEAKGRLLNERRVGIWEYYDQPGELSLKMDYATGKLLYIKPDTSDFYILRDSTWVKSKLTRACRFHGTYPPLLKFYSSRFYAFLKLPKEVLQKGPFVVWLTFEVQEDGIARNPEVIHDPGHGVKSDLLELFGLAQNAWIPGKIGEKTVRCKMAIGFSVGETVIQSMAQEDIHAKIISVCQNKTIIRPEAIFHFRSDFLEQGLQWSPDDQHIAFTSTDLGLKVKPVQGGHKSIHILNANTKKITDIESGQIQRYYWLNNDSLLYSFREMEKQLGLFDLRQSVSSLYADSLIFFPVVCFRDNKMAFVSHSQGTTFLWEADLKSRSVRKVTQTKTLGNFFRPLEWSPDGSLLLSEEFDKASGVSLLFLQDIVNNRRMDVLPRNSVYSGWSADNRYIFLTLVEPTVNLPFLTICRYDLASHQKIILHKRSKQITEVKYSPVQDKLLVIQNSNVYIMSSQPGEAMEKIIENAHSVSWSNGGKYIAYSSKLDNGVHIMEFATRMTRPMTMGIKFEY